MCNSDGPIQSHRHGRFLDFQILTTCNGSMGSSIARKVMDQVNPPVLSIQTFKHSTGSKGWNIRRLSNLLRTHYLKIKPNFSNPSKLYLGSLFVRVTVNGPVRRSSSNAILRLSSEQSCDNGRLTRAPQDVWSSSILEFKSEFKLGFEFESEGGGGLELEGEAVDSLRQATAISKFQKTKNISDWNACERDKYCIPQLINSIIHSTSNIQTYLGTDSPAVWR